MTKQYQMIFNTQFQNAPTKSQAKEKQQNVTHTTNFTTIYTSHFFLIIVKKNILKTKKIKIKLNLTYH